MNKVEVEKNNIHLEAVLVEMGSDLLIAVMGGDKPHIGCTAISVPRPSLSNPSAVSATTSTINLIGHKDDAIANLISSVVCKSLNAPVVVVCGVHIEKAGQEEIEIVRELSTMLVDKILMELKKDGD